MWEEAKIKIDNYKSKITEKDNIMKSMFGKLQEETQKRINLGTRVEPDLSYLLRGANLSKTQKRVLEHQAKTVNRFKHDVKAKMFYQHNIQNWGYDAEEDSLLDSNFYKMTNNKLLEILPKIYYPVIKADISSQDNIELAIVL